MDKSKFIVHEHNALKKGKHWDIRFKRPHDSNWDSFASNMTPPTEKGIKSYIVKTTLHSEEQALFTGTIPKGEYGAGHLSIWDQGSCDIEKYSNAHIVITFHGSKIKGRYHFISTGVFGRKKDYKKKVYMFFKASDQGK